MTSFHASYTSGGAGCATSNDSDLKELHLKINKKQNESLESTRRMVALCEEAQHAGIETADTLNQQGEKLKRIEEDLDRVNAGVKGAETSLDELEKCCGLCVLPWRRAWLSGFTDDTSWKTPNERRVNTEDPKATTEARIEPSSLRAAANSGPILLRITNDEHEVEMEENLQQVSTIVGSLRSMAVDMRTEIDAQNAILDRMNDKTERTDIRVRDADKRIRKMVRND